MNRGQTVHFKVRTDSTNYRLDIYRLGYYGGSGSRLIATVQPSAPLPQIQLPCLTDTDPPTGLIDCGNWAESASWAVPANATSGIYIAKLVREDSTAGSAHIAFVVRDDSSASDFLFQTSDTTWQAYNYWGGNSLYTGAPDGRAYKVSYNRPFATREGVTSHDWLFDAEYPMVRFLEANGYDLSYFTGVDSDRRGVEIQQHKVFLSVGHDEYWSGNQRANVEAARNAGVNLAFFSGNIMFWKTRWENSIDGSGTSYRTMVCYKETHANDKIDPLANVWTGTWRDPRFSPPADGGRPENALIGTIFAVNNPANESVKVPEALGKYRFWRNTGVATQSAGQTAIVGTNTVGYEWDEDNDNGYRPSGLIRLSVNTVNVNTYLLDYGSNYGNGTATHSLTLYKHSSGALVFSAAATRWSWGLDDHHDLSGEAPVQPDPNMRQATVNLFADMGVQPTTLQSGLVATPQSTDTLAPTSTITSPVTGANLAVGTPVTVSGTASDTGGGLVAGVNISFDGGATWHRTDGTTAWSYSWTPSSVGSIAILSRAVDDSGNPENPPAEHTATVSAQGCPCSIWANTVTPNNSLENDGDPVELGLKFRSDAAGYIIGVKFYKGGAANGGTHVGHLWSSTGTLLGAATFSGETASGWQQASFPSPIAITANTTYVISYFAPQGRYAADGGYFAFSGVNNGALHALSNAQAGGNGVYHYGATGGFPTDTSASTNYWVDVLFSDPTQAPPQVLSMTPASRETGVPAEVAPTAGFSEALDPASVNTSTVLLRDMSNNPVTANVSYAAETFTVTLTPQQALQAGQVYTMTLKGGAASPHITDSTGTPLAADFTWQFITAQLPSPLPILIITRSSNKFTQYYQEILRAEGFNNFNTLDIAQVTDLILSQYDVAILGEMPLTSSQVTMLSNWVTAGGNLIAMRPDKQLASLLGISDAASSRSDAYLRVNTAQEPGAGIVGEPIQYHSAADLYTLNGATAVATIYSDPTQSTSNPAVTLRSVGTNGGQSAAFTFDLARSIVYTRQGNPAWAGQERDHQDPDAIRSDDLFYGGGDPDYINLDKAAIPQADELQRLLGNMILSMNADRRPLPRFWYFPNMKKAVILMTGDDHGTDNGTQTVFDMLIARSPQNCSVGNWDCYRATSWVYTDSGLTNTQAVAYQNQGFELGVHVNTNCENWTPQTLDSFFTNDIAGFAAKYMSIPQAKTNRTHCLVWTDWATQPKVELSHGIRLDETYYYWPMEWAQNHPGFMTGSGMPMRYADLDGSIIDVYQAATHLTNETDNTSDSINSMLDKALGAEGYYGVFGTHYNYTDQFSTTILNSAQARNVSLISAQQLLTWLDGRNSSSFGSPTWNGTQLAFSMTVGAGANNLYAMLPNQTTGGQLTSLTINGSTVSFAVETIKGRSYAVFRAANGNAVATYAP